MEHEDTISLQDYLAVLRRQRWIVLTVTVLVVVAALGFSLAQTPIYDAEAEVVLEPVRRTQDVTLEEILAPQADVVQTERLVVTSRPVATRVAEQLGLTDANEALEEVRVEAVADTRVVRIVAEHPDPVAAAERADAFAAGYLDFRRDDAIEGLLAAQEGLAQRAADIQEQIDAFGSDRNVVEEAQRDALLTQLSTIATQQAEAGDAQSAVSGGGTILTPAEIAEEPVSPQPVRTGALAVVLGLLLGVGLAFLRDHVDDVIRDENDFKRATSGRSILGRIPSWEDPDGGHRLASIVEPASLASEAYRELSAGVRFLLVAHEQDAPATASDGTPLGRSIIVCSAAAGDGKTSTAANLAVSAARVGLRTLLVDADLRRSTVGSRFGVSRGTGLSDLLLEHGALHDHVLDVGVENLRVLPAGTIPPNPNELLASPAMRALERDILRRVDLVIYDTPAVLAVPDALELGRHVDFAILVGRAGVTGRRQLQAAVERLTQVGTEVAGTVLNGIRGRADGYYYAYYYADEAGGETRASGGVGDVSESRRQAKKRAKEREKRAAAETKAARKASRKTSTRGGGPTPRPAEHPAAAARDGGDEVARTAVRRIDAAPEGTSRDGTSPGGASRDDGSRDVGSLDVGSRDVGSRDVGSRDDADVTDELTGVRDDEAVTADSGDLLFGEDRR